MPPETWTALLGNMGLPAIIIGWGAWFFQTQVWPKFTSHLDKVGELVDSVRVIATNDISTRERVDRIDGGVQELLVRIPQRSHHEKEAG